MVLASTGLNKACNVTSGSLSVRPSLSEEALKVAWTVPASKSTNRTPSAPVKSPVPFQTTLMSIRLPLSKRLLEPALSRCTARGTTMTSLETTAGPTVTFKVAPAVDTVRVTPCPEPPEAPAEPEADPAPPDAAEPPPFFSLLSRPRQAARTGTPRTDQPPTSNARRDTRPNTTHSPSHNTPAPPGHNQPQRHTRTRQPPH